MKITEMHVTPIAITDPPLLNAAGLHAPYALRIIVELVTDDNIYGLGEVPGSAATTAGAGGRTRSRHRPGSVPTERHPAGPARTALARQARPHAARRPGTSGASSTSTAPSRSPASTSWARPPADRLSICWADASRDRVDFSAYLFYKYEGAGGALGFDTDPDATGWAAARQAGRPRSGRRRRPGAGHVRGVRLQVDQAQGRRHAARRRGRGHAGPARGLWAGDAAAPRSQRHLVGGDGHRCGKQMEGMLEYYEDPVRGQEAMAQVGQAVDIPMATNMCTTSFEDIPGSVRARLRGHHPQRPSLLGRAAHARSSWRASARPLAAASPCTPTATSASR